MNNTLEGIIINAVQVYTGMITFYPQFNQESTINVSEIVPKFPGRFAVNNSTVAFVSDGNFYVTPYTRQVIKTLRENDFREDIFYVPFSNGDYPKEKSDFWEMLWQNARVSWKEEFTEDCKSYCDKHGIGPLDEETLQNCFKMPDTGVKVNHPYFETCYYPILNKTCFDCTVSDYLGHYCTNNGRVVFVYRDGTTYVTKGYKILNKLREAGYREAGMFVPFSNGEEILDPVLRKRWEDITK